MKKFNWKNFLLGCLTGVAILTAKYYWENRTMVIGYPEPKDSAAQLEVEEISFPTPLNR